MDNSVWHQVVPFGTLVVLAMVSLGVAGNTTHLKQQFLGGASKNIELIELWRIGDSEDDEVLFSRLLDNSIAIDSEGQIYVADWGPNVYVLDSGGRLVTTMGTRGSGPGEFEAATGVFVDPMDEIFVFDLQQRRLTGFSSGGSEISLIQSLWGSELSFPSQLVGVDSTGFYIAYRSPYSGSGKGLDRLEAPRTVDLHFVDRNGRRDPAPIVTLPNKKSVVMQDRWGGFSVYQAPFPPEPRMLMSQVGLFYTGFGGSLDINVRTVNGKVVRELHRNHKPIPVTARELEEFFEGSSSEFQKKAGSPEFKPAFQYFEVDDAENLWVKLSSPEGAALATWIVIDSYSNEQLASVQLPNAVRLEAIRGGRAYAVHTVEGEAPFIIAFQIK